MERFKSGIQMLDFPTRNLNKIRSIEIRHRVPSSKREHFNVIIDLMGLTGNASGNQL